jgi:hypothetical protein
VAEPTPTGARSPALDTVAIALLDDCQVAVLLTLVALWLLKNAVAVSWRAGSPSGRFAVPVIVIVVTVAGVGVVGELPQDMADSRMPTEQSPPPIRTIDERTAVSPNAAKPTAYLVTVEGIAHRQDGSGRP